MTDVLKIIEKFWNSISDRKTIRRFFRNVKRHIMVVYLPTLLCFLKWILFALTIGIIVGVIGTAFYYGIQEATTLRQNYPFLIILLPIAGLAIVGIYYLLGIPKDMGTNTVLLAVREHDKLTPQQLVCIFVGSILTHLCGGSSGREGAALQIGGCVGSFVGNIIKLDDDDKRVLVMCGMSAGFSALFGTPVAAALFSIEVVSVGIFHYSAIVPCMVSSATGYAISDFFGIHFAKYSVNFPTVSIEMLIKTLIFAVACGVASWFVCYTFKISHDILSKVFKNLFLRAAVGGIIIVILTFLSGTYDYNGVGTEIIMSSFENRAIWSVCLLKLFFTAITLGSGFKGGEILPVFFIGATFGSFMSGLLGVDVSFLASIGMVSLFCGVTNCPVTSIIIGIELFGSKGILYIGIACAVSYMLSGYRGLYSEQKIAYSKLKTKFIDKKVGKF